MPRRRTDPVPRKRPRQERSTVTVDAILIAVEQVLDRHGLAGLTTNRVAEVAGVSVGTLYQYFPNKESLVGAVQERYLGQTLAGVRAVLAAARGVPALAVVDGIERALVATAQVQRPIHRWLIELRTAAAYQDRYREEMDVFVAELAEFLAARDDVRFSDSRAAAFALAHAILGVVQAVVARAPMDLAPVARAACDMVRTYIAANAPR